MSAQLGLSVLFELKTTDGSSGFSGAVSAGLMGTGAGEEKALPAALLRSEHAKKSNSGERALLLVAMSQDIGSPVVAWTSSSSLRHQSASEATARRLRRLPEGNPSHREDQCRRT